MVLNPTVRGQTEQAIDSAKRDIINDAKILFDPKNRSELQIKEPNDFILCWVLGGLYQIGVYAVLSTLARPATQEERLEIGSILYRRFPELHDAIFKAG
jgi:hypothetical protein